VPRPTFQLPTGATSIEWSGEFRTRCRRPRKRLAIHGAGESPFVLNPGCCSTARSIAAHQPPAPLALTASRSRCAPASSGSYVAGLNFSISAAVCHESRCPARVGDGRAIRLLNLKPTACATTVLARPPRRRDPEAAEIAHAPINDDALSLAIGLACRRLSNRHRPARSSSRSPTVIVPAACWLEPLFRSCLLDPGALHQLFSARTKPRPTRPPKPSPKPGE